MVVELVTVAMKIGRLQFTWIPAKWNFNKLWVLLRSSVSNTYSYELYIFVEQGFIDYKGLWVNHKPIYLVLRHQSAYIGFSNKLINQIKDKILTLKDAYTAEIDGKSYLFI